GQRRQPGEEVSAHGGDDAERRTGAPHPSERATEVGRLGGIALGDDFFQLIDEEQEPARAADLLAQCARDLGRIADDLPGYLSLVAAEMGAERGRERSHRMPARHQRRGLPSLAESALLDRGDHARARERRLAHSGVADDERERLAAQAPYQLAHRSVAAEEEGAVAGLESLQALVGILGGVRGVAPRGTQLIERLP